MSSEPRTNSIPSPPSPTWAELSICGVLATSSLDLFTPPIGVPLSLILIALLLHWRREPWSNLGLRRPQRWWPLWSGALAGALALQTASLLLLLPLLERFGIPMPDFSAFAALEGNPVLLGVYLLSPGRRQGSAKRSSGEAS